MSGHLRCFIFRKTQAVPIPVNFHKLVDQTTVTLSSRVCQRSPYQGYNCFKTYQQGSYYTYFTLLLVFSCGEEVWIKNNIFFFQLHWQQCLDSLNMPYQSIFPKSSASSISVWHHSTWFSSFHYVMFQSRPIHCLMLSSHHILCLPLHLPACGAYCCVCSL